MDRRSFIRLAGLSPVIALLSGTGRNGGGPTLVHAEGGETGARIVLSGDYGHEQQQIRDLMEATIDARDAFFTVANSKNANPNAIIGCTLGTSQVNPYPLVIRNCPGVRFMGGRFNGEVPLTSDRQYIYCNSAALLVRDGTANATIEGVRARRCWDGIRFAEGANGFRLKGSWLSEIRDDAVENDYLVGGVIEDCLFDGCFAGISMDPGSRDQDGTREIVWIDRSLIRMGAYLADGETTHQAPIKAADVSPGLRITGSIFALSAANMRGLRRLERTWQRMVESRDNALLWLPDGPVPSALPLPPSGFTVLTGASAREYWDKARRRWITEHPGVARFSDEAP